MFEPVMKLGELEALLDEHFPQIRNADTHFHIRSIGTGRIAFALETNAAHLRPGGTVSGPTLFALADVAIYTLILAHRGRSAFGAVTTGMTINFLTRPKPGSLEAEAKLLRLGRRLAVAEVAIRSGDEDPCAHAVGTYAIPSEASTPSEIAVT